MNVNLENCKICNFDSLTIFNRCNRNQIALWYFFRYFFSRKIKAFVQNFNRTRSYRSILRNRFFVNRMVENFWFLTSIRQTNGRYRRTAFIITIYQLLSWPSISVIINEMHVLLSRQRVTNNSLNLLFRGRTRNQSLMKLALLL